MDINEKYEVNKMKRLFRYDSKTGKLYWSNDESILKRYRGKEVKCINSDGYYIGSKDKINYAVHNVVWVINNGPIPKDQTVAHRDRNKLNNKLENLRLATQEQQLANRDFVGFFWKRGAFRAQRSQKYLGRFQCPLLARIAVHSFLVESFGEFAPEFLTQLQIPGNPYALAGDWERLRTASKIPEEYRE